MTTFSRPVEDGQVEAILADCRRRDVRFWFAVVGLTALLFAALGIAGGFQQERYTNALAIIGQLLLEAVPPDFSRLSQWWHPLLETVAMSISATLIGAAMALPLALLGARNSGVHPVLSTAARLLLNAARSVPELVFGIIFVAAIGFGPIAGVLALSFHSVGMLGKFVAEHLEHLDPAPADALRSHGVSRAGIVRFGLLPQVMPRLIDVALYRWEHNVRAASVMGLVGAGGLGRELVTAFSLFNYREASALLLMILAVVCIIDALSFRLRKSWVERT